MAQCDTENGIESTRTSKEEKVMQFQWNMVPSQKVQWFSRMSDRTMGRVVDCIVLSHCFQEKTDEDNRSLVRMYSYLSTGQCRFLDHDVGACLSVDQRCRQEDANSAPIDIDESIQR